MESQQSLLLLLFSLSNFGQGLALFLSFGLHSGLVKPLVALREAWLTWKGTLFSEDEAQERPDWTDVFQRPRGPHYERLWLEGMGDIPAGEEWEEIPEAEQLFQFSGSLSEGQREESENRTGE